MTIATLTPGDEVDSVFACTRKDRLTARTGTPYLALELRDRTGTIEGRAFRDADMLAGRFERGDVIRVRGRVERFRDALQVEVSAVERAAADPSAFLPTAYRDVEELDGFLEHLAREVYDPGLRALLDSFLGDAAVRAEFRRAPCTRGGHHAYLGGLLEHTVAVAQLAHELCTIHPGLDADVLLTAALLHDIGKTREFTYGADIGVTEEGRLLGHLALGQRLIEERAGSLPEDRRLALLHCVLMHHGGEGRRFASAEALALYRVNALDAGVKAALMGGAPAAPRAS